MGLAVNEGFVDPTIEAIIQGARTGDIGGGKIPVLELRECTRTSTGERRSSAVG